MRAADAEKIDTGFEKPNKAQNWKKQTLLLQDRCYYADVLPLRYFNAR
jgi:hypothetical protein